MRRLAAAGAILALVSSLFVAVPPAFAHAFLVDTSPQAGERLQASPSSIAFQFSEPVVEGADRLTVTDDGDEIALADTRLERGGSMLSVDLSGTLPQGAYVVSWRVTSAVDGHLEEGEFAFGVGVAGSTPADARSSDLPPAAQVVATLLFLSGLVLAVGGLVSEAVVWRFAAAVDALTRAPIRSAIAVSLIGALLQLVLLLAPRASPEVGLDGAFAVLGARVGILAIVKIGSVAAALLLVQLGARTWALIPLSGGVIAAAYASHAAADSWWGGITNALHIAVAAIWVGALVHLLLLIVRRRQLGLQQLIPVAARRYATLALVVVIPLIPAGVATALTQLSDPAELVATSYGRLLMAKAILVVIVLLLASTARLRALPRAAARIRPLRRLVSAEVFALAGVIALTAALANTAPPPSPAASLVLGPPPVDRPAIRLADRVGHLSVYVAAAEDLLRIEVRGPGGGRKRSAIAVSGSEPDGREIQLYPRSCGKGCFTVRHEWQPGPTRLEMSVESERWSGGRATVVVAWPRRAADPELLERILSTMRERRRIVLSEAVTSTPGPMPSPYTASLAGEDFASTELYAAGGAVDVVRLPGGRWRSVSFYLPGSATWYRLWFDRSYRVRRETIVNPGHGIERSFEYRH